MPKTATKRKGDKASGEKIDSIDSDDPAEKEDDLGGSAGDEASFEAQQKNLDVGDEAGDSVKKTKKRGSADKDGGEKAVVKKVKSEDIDIDVDVQSLFEGEEDFSDEFKQRAGTIFEVVVKNKIEEEVNKIAEQYESALEEATEDIKDTLSERVDDYLSYVTEEWMKENEVAVEAGIRTEVTESFINGLKELFENHYIEIPEEKVDAVSELMTKNESLEEQVKELLNNNISISKKYTKCRMSNIIEENAGELTETDKLKFAKLVEGISYDNEAQLVEKMDIIKGKFFGSSSTSTTDAGDELQDLNEEDHNSDVTTNMSKNMKAAMRVSGNLARAHNQV